MKTPLVLRCSLAVITALAGACATRQATAPLLQLVPPTAGVGLNGPGRTYLEGLAADVDGMTRASALDVLVRVSQSPGGGKAGVAATWDPDPWVQRTAVAALEVRRAEPESQQRLMELTTRPGVDPYVRCRAAVLLPEPVAPEVLQAVHESWTRVPLWKAAPCAAAEASWGSAEAAGKLIEAVEQGALALDPSFVRTLSTLDVAGLDAAMGRGLAVADELVRPALTRALLERDDNAALVALRASLNSEDPQVRMEAVVLLSEVLRPDTDQLLEKAAQASDTPEGQLAALVLAARGDAAFGVFEAAFAGDNRDIRRAAIRFGAQQVARQEHAGKGRTARKKLEKLLAMALVDPDPFAQEEAVRQVGTLRVVGLKPVVDALAEDPETDLQVRVGAIEAAVALSVRLP